MLHRSKFTLLLAATSLLAACSNTSPDRETTPPPEPVTIPTVEPSTPEPTPTSEPTPTPEMTASPSPEPTMSTSTSPEKTIALTFDDGPGKDTEAILQILDEADVTATFFVLGSNITPQNQHVLANASQGHQIAMHTWSHSDLKSLSDEEILDELDRTADKVEEVTGERPTCYRPPYGSSNKHIRDLTRDHGYEERLWNIDSEDWRRPGVDTIAKNSEKPPYDKQEAVLLMHDAGGERSQTIDALPQVIQHYKDEGYKFVPAC